MQRVHITNSPKERGAWPRYINIAIGAWLVASAFLLPHAGGSQMNTWMTGALVVLVGIGALYAPTMRGGNVILGIVLLVLTPITTTGSTLTIAHNVLAALALIAVGLIPTGTGVRDQHERHEPHAAR